MDWLAKKMREANFPISAIHGDMPQKDWNRMICLHMLGCYVHIHWLKHWGASGNLFFLWNNYEKLL